MLISKIMKTIIMIVIIVIIEMIVIGNMNEQSKYSIWYWALTKYSFCNWYQKQIQVSIDKIYLLFTASVCGSLRKNNLAATICTIITIIVLISDGLKRNKKTNLLFIKILTKTVVDCIICIIWFERTKLPSL